MGEPGRPTGMNRAPISRRVALAAASVLVLALSACGQSTSSSATVPGTLPVIRVAGAGAQGAALAADSAEGSKMMASNLTFVFDGVVPDLTSPAGSWFFPSGVRASDDVVRSLAAALGVQGDIVVQPADMGGGRMIGSTDYTQPSVYVSDDALSTWWYNGNQAAGYACAVEPSMPADSASSSGTDSAPMAPDAVPADTVPGDSILIDPMPCEMPPPPTGVPTQDEATAKARDLLASLGIDPASYEFETYADEWGANVTGYLVLDGSRTNLSVSVGYGGEGALTWASGFFATPQRGADYPRIGVEAAVERLNDQQSSMMRGWGAADASAMTDIATVEPSVAPEPLVECEIAVGDTETTAITDTPCITIDTIAIEDPIMIDEPIQLEEIVITLADPQPSLEQLWDVDGTVWLVPGYSFSSDGGGVWTIAAIGDEYLQIEDVAVEPEPVPVETTPVDTANGSSGACAAGTPDTMPFAVDGSSLVGLCLDDAIATAEANGLTVRVVRQDGEDLAVTADLQPQRVNVVVVDDVVTEVQGLG
jgi:hypothetical protein